VGLRRRSNASPPSVGEPVDAVRVADAAPRTPVRIVGQVVRIRSRPASGLPSLAVTISDDSGSIVAVWTGRRSIGGVTLGRRLVVEGVGRRVGRQLELTNPAYTLLP
jgi:hypothetical protein